MFAAYADLVSDVGPIETPFLLVVVACMQSWLAGSHAALPIGMAGTVLAFEIDYPIVFLIATLAAVVPFLGRDRRRMVVFVLAVGGAAVVALIVHLLYTMWQLGSASFFLDLNLARTAYTRYRPDLVTWLTRMVAWNVPLLLSVLLGGVALWIATGLTRSRKLRLRWPRIDARGSGFLKIVLLGFGVSYMLVGSEGAVVHEYWGYVLLPGGALVAAEFWSRALEGEVRPEFLRWSWCLVLPYVALFAGIKPGVGPSIPGLLSAGLAIVGIVALRKSPALGAVALTSLVALNLYYLVIFLPSQQSNRRELALAIRDLTPPNSVIVTTDNAVPQMLYYSDRLIVPNSVQLGAHLPKWHSMLETRSGTPCSRPVEVRTCRLGRPSCVPMHLSTSCYRMFSRLADRRLWAGWRSHAIGARSTRSWCTSSAAHARSDKYQEPCHGRGGVEDLVGAPQLAHLAFEFGDALLLCGRHIGTWRLSVIKAAVLCRPVYGWDWP